MRLCLAATIDGELHAVSLKYILLQSRYPYEHKNAPKGVMLDVISMNGNTGKCEFYKSGGSNEYASTEAHNIANTTGNRYRISKN